MSHPVSVIIPVYNTAPYLRQCVESVTGQSYRALEVILVDDGSTDGSGALCEELKEQDDRILVLHQMNSGLSEARNNGLDAASGDFVLFLDSDDYWPRRDVVSRLVRTFDRYPDCDFLGFNWLLLYPDGSAKQGLNFAAYVRGKADGHKALLGILRSGTTPMSACTKIIRRSFLLREGITFVPHLTSEDIPWFMELLTKCRHCRFLPGYYYAYRQQVGGSITHSYTRERLRDLRFIIDDGVEKAGDPSAKKMRYVLLSFYATEYCILLSHLDLVAPEEREEWRSWVRSHRFLLQYDLSPKVQLAHHVARLLGLGALSRLLRLRYRLMKSR